MSDGYWKLKLVYRRRRFDPILSWFHRTLSLLLRMCWRIMPTASPTLQLWELRHWFKALTYAQITDHLWLGEFPNESLGTICFPGDKRRTLLSVSLHRTSCLDMKKHENLPLKAFKSIRGVE
jgi:hypothetical protein